MTEKVVIDPRQLIVAAVAAGLLTGPDDRGLTVEAVVVDGQVHMCGWGGCEPRRRRIEEPLQHLPLVDVVALSCAPCREELLDTDGIRTPALAVTVTLVRVSALLDRAAGAVPGVPERVVGATASARDRFHCLANLLAQAAQTGNTPQETIRRLGEAVTALGDRLTTWSGSARYARHCWRPWSRR
jgi:hypothetical protein